MGDAKRSTVGTYQHYLPAAFLGRFSADTKKRTRSRPLWVRTLAAPRSHVSSASKVGGEIGLYDVDDDSLGPEKTLDYAWGYESFVPEALDALERRDPQLDARGWLLGAVPLVAGLFARGPEFQKEFAERLPAELRKNSPHLGGPNMATGARLVDLQVLLAPILAARWAVVHFPGDAQLITNDRGYALTSTPGGGLPSYAIPIGRHAALVVTPRDRGTPIRWSDESWVVDIAHFDADASEAAGLNRAIGGFARQAVFGSSQEAVDTVGAYLGKADRLTAGLFVVLDPASHLYDYFRLLIATAEPPEANGSLIGEVDWKKISSEHWRAPVVVECLFPDRTRGGVSIRDGRISVDLTYGIEQRRARKQVADFRMGALSQVDLGALQHTQLRPGEARSASVRFGRVEDLHKAADAVAAFDRGKDALAAGRLAQAEAEFRESDRLGNPAGSVNLGNLLRMKGDLRGAEGAFRRAVRRGNTNGSLNLGAIYLDRGQFREAERQFTRAQRAGNPRAEEFLQMLAQARRRPG